MENRGYPSVFKGGGLYHNHKVEYSSETHSLIKRLLDESKLSILQRKTLQNSLKNGDPLPGPGLPGSRESCKKICQKQILIRPLTSKRRTQEAILESGAYEPDRYFSTKLPKDNEKEKLRLQNLMAYGREESVETKEVKTRLRMTNSAPSKRGANEKDDFFDHLLQEVEEREEFLEDMEKLGEAKKYKEMIENEIASKLRNMEKIDKKRFEKETGAVSKYRNKFHCRGPPKSLPLTALDLPNTK
ncbi:hypothetical protein LSTR_LSTR001788 [Laodelphax striatellus]|uniref:Uncharacterized protein n=1 Tax=Laodelphax striatellus TaxID=195883 RepID=A0A482WFP6_LAOST|nr:hypothetical protein LSTR_LSTR001788 [Laodelphax striatellus]